jgi:hypothetical protein
MVLYDFLVLEEGPRSIEECRLSQLWNINNEMIIVHFDCSKMIHECSILLTSPTNDTIAMYLTNEY